MVQPSFSVLLIFMASDRVWQLSRITACWALSTETASTWMEINISVYSILIGPHLEYYL